MSSKDTVEALAKSMDEAVSEDKAKFEANVVAMTNDANCLAIAMMDRLFKGEGGLVGRSAADAPVIAGAVLGTIYENIRDLIKRVASQPGAPVEAERILLSIFGSQIQSTISKLRDPSQSYFHTKAGVEPATQFDITPAGKAALAGFNGEGAEPATDGEDASGS